MRKIYLFIFINLTFLLNAQEVQIQADHFHADDISKMAYFEGNAEIKHGLSEFYASKIVVYFNKKKKASKYEAIGNVRFDITENGVHYKGHAQKISYQPNSSKYFFWGDVLLMDLTNNRKIEAQKISLDLKTGYADITGGKKKPVRFIFEIEDRK
jgi:lipopolysaccharide export system protein LptA